VPEGKSRLITGLRAVLSIVCWFLAVVSAFVTAGAFAGGGVLCQRSGVQQACSPQTWLLIVAVVLTLGFGTAGALLWKPKPKDNRRPWEYRS
jgi:hypothetical protein